MIIAALQFAAFLTAVLLLLWLAHPRE